MEKRNRGSAGGNQKDEKISLMTVNDSTRDLFARADKKSRKEIMKTLKMIYFGSVATAVFCGSALIGMIFSRPESSFLY